MTGEGLPLMRVEGHGDVFFAADAQELFLVDLEDDALSVNGRNVLAFDPGLSWEIRKVGGAGMLGGGLFNTVLSGRGRVAVSSYGNPVVLRTDEAPTFVDTQSVICWSANLQTELKKSFSAGALVGRGSGRGLPARPARAAASSSCRRARDRRSRPTATEPDPPSGQAGSAKTTTLSS